MFSVSFNVQNIGFVSGEVPWESLLGIISIMFRARPPVVVAMPLPLYTPCLPPCSVASTHGAKRDMYTSHAVHGVVFKNECSRPRSTAQRLAEGMSTCNECSFLEGFCVLEQISP